MRFFSIFFLLLATCVVEGRPNLYGYYRFLNGSTQPKMSTVKFSISGWNNKEEWLDLWWCKAENDCPDIEGVYIAKYKEQPSPTKWSTITSASCSGNVINKETSVVTNDGTILIKTIYAQELKVEECPSTTNNLYWVAEYQWGFSEPKQIGSMTWERVK